MRDLTLFRGVVVRVATPVTLEVRGSRAELRVATPEGGDALAYRARVVPDDSAPVPPRSEGGDPSPIALADFYAGITFHGPLLQGLVDIEAIGATFARGTVHVGTPGAWSSADPRAAFTASPLAVDSAFQLAALVAWHRYQRAGTPVSLGALRILRAPSTAVLDADVHFAEPQDDRFSATVVLRDADGPVLVVEQVVAELRKVEGAAPAWVPAPEATDPTRWQEVQDLTVRLEGLAAMGLQNPYFHVHQGTARDTTQVDGHELINFSSYNYIGLSGDAEVLDAVHAAVDRYGTSVSASRVASGERPFHHELEAELAAAQGTEDAILYTAGHATNVSTIGHLFGPDDLILHDEYIHDSALQGIKLSGAARRGFRHDDPEHLATQLAQLRPHYRRCLIIVEGVYSMDGDLCRLPDYVALKERWGCLLMVDEAHSFGVVGATGRGICEATGVDPRKVDLFMGTLSKSLASCGGWIAASKHLITYLRYTSPGFVYSAGLTAANGVAALASLRKMLREPWRVAKLQDNAAFFHGQLVERGMDTGPALGGSGVIPVITGNSFHALVLSQRLREQGINVQPIVYPAVPDDASRLRFFLSSTHSHEQLARTAAAVATTLTEIREAFPAP